MTALRKLACAAAMAAALGSSALAAQPAAAPARPMFERTAPPASPAQSFPLYAGPVPGAAPSTAPEVWDLMLGQNLVLRNVTRPTLTPFLPAPGKATGAAVIVLPGGGFTVLAMKDEGWSVARWLADHGVAAFVLKYRTASTPDDETALVGSLTRSMGAMMVDPERTLAPLAPPAVADAIEALKRVRTDAAKWQVDPARVGMVGFSAGAMATRSVVLTPDPAQRPAFFGYVYGPMSAVDVPAGAPPMFAALALDDPLFARAGFGIVDAWRKAKVPVELHGYEAGGHGFGMGKPGTTTTMLMPEFLAWMQARGLLERIKASAARP